MNIPIAIRYVGDVWLDAGIVPFSTLGYFTDKEDWEKNFPAEWVIEMQEQVRLWFYSQLFMSVTITGRAPYERVQTNNWVLAENGTKFSKTGFMIRFDEVAENMGADATRYLFAGASMTSDVRFGFTLLKETHRKLYGFLNIYSFFITYAEIDKPNITEDKSLNSMDNWLIHRVNDFVLKATKYYENYSLPELIDEFELCVDDVSNWYVRVNRRRFWKDMFDEDKRNAYNSLFYAIKTMAQVMAPVLPFMTEYIWQEMVLKYGVGEESIHLSEFPKFINDVDTVMLETVEKVRAVIAQALKLRNEKNLKVKQPLSVLYLDSKLEYVCDCYIDIIKEELNVKDIVYLSDFSVLSIEYLSLNFQKAGKYLKGDLNRVKELLDHLTEEEMASCVSNYKNDAQIMLNGFDATLPMELFVLQTKEKENIAKAENGILVAIDVKITEELKKEGIFREILRHCQVLRKKAGFSVSDRVMLDFVTDSPLIGEVIEWYRAEMMRETLSEIRCLDEFVLQKEMEVNGCKLLIKIGR